MARSLTIDFDPKQAETGALIHRVRNFGEDVYRHMQANDWGDIKLAEIDAATTQLTIQDIKSSNLRRLVAWLENELKRHHLIAAISN